jgi:putative flippase GtrA
MEDAKLAHQGGGPRPLQVQRFFRFVLVGGLGFAVDAGLLALLHHGAGIDPFLARVVSIAAAALFTWRMNRALTFGASATSQTTEGLRYALVAALTAGMNYLFYALALTVWPTLPPVWAAMIATLFAMSVSYPGYSRFVFSGARTVLSSPSSQRR